MAKFNRVLGYWILFHYELFAKLLVEARVELLVGGPVLRAEGVAAAGLGGPHHHRVVRVGGEATRVSSKSRLAERLERQDGHTVRRVVECDELERAGQRQRGPGLHRGGQHLHSHIRQGTQQARPSPLPAHTATQDMRELTSPPSQTRP